MTPHQALVQISVVIPSRDRPAQLERCLDALSGQRGASTGVEVIVADDGGGEPLDRLVEAFRHRLRLRVVRGTGAGPASARNLGARHAVGRWLAFIDDDCRPHEDWQASLERRLLQWPSAMIAGGAVNGLPDNAYAAATQAIVSASAEHYARRSGSPRLFTTSNLTMPAEGFKRLGGFDAAFPRAAGEDYDLCERWHRQGGSTVPAPEVVVLHEHPLGLRTFLRQHLNYGRGLLLYRTKLARREGRRLRTQTPAFYVGLLRWPFSHESGRRAFAITGLVALSQVATAVGAAQQALRGSR